MVERNLLGMIKTQRIISILIFLAFIVTIIPMMPNVKADSTLILRPNANGDANVWDMFGDDANWKCVDDVTPDYTTTYVKSWLVIPPSGFQELYNIENSSESGTISSINVSICIYAEWGDPDDWFKLGIKLGSDNATGSDRTSELVYPWAFVNISQEWTTNPWTTSAWQWSEINNLQIGPVFQPVGDMSSCYRVTQMYIKVNYTSTPTSLPSPGTTTYLTHTILNIIIAVAILGLIVGIILTMGATKESLITIMIITTLGIIVIQIILGL